MPPIGQIASILPSLGMPFAFLILFLWLYYHYFDRVLLYLGGRLNNHSVFLSRRLSRRQLLRWSLLIVLLAYTVGGSILTAILSLVIELLSPSDLLLKTSWAAFGISLVLAWGIVYLSGKPKATSQSPSVTLSGEVFWSESSQPVEGAIVTVAGSGTEYRTSSLGHFEATMPRPTGRLEIVARLGSITTSCVLTRTEAKKPLRLLLPETILIRGNVLNKTSGYPIQGAMVSLDGLREAICKTDGTGYFEIAGPACEVYRLRVVHHGEVTVSVLGLRDVETAVAVYLTGRVSLRGNVYWSHSQEPVLGAIVVVDGQRGSWVTNEQGYFEVATDASDRIRLHFSVPGARSRTENVDLEHAAHTGLRVLMERESSSVRVIEHSPESRVRTSQPTEPLRDTRAAVLPEEVSLPGGAPALEFVRVPAGPSTMGSSEAEVESLIAQVGADYFRCEMPQREESLPTFAVAITPVTVAQFSPFVLGDGYFNPDYWDEAGLAWKGNKRAPRYWTDTKWTSPTSLPVVGITWYEADAYCKWVSLQSGYQLSLPTERQWEKAARGRDGRCYPWGDSPPTNLHCNYGNSIGMTTPVGAYRLGASPYGALDMAGNVWEWCSTAWQAKGDEHDAPSIEEKPIGKVMRGGCYNSDPYFVRTAARTGNEPRYSNNYVGFRCVIVQG